MAMLRNAVARSLFVTPLPPTKSGTADYVYGLLASLGEERTREVVFVVDRAVDSQTSFAGRPVVGAGELEPRDDDVWVYFIANNRFHYHALALLDRHRSGRAVVVIHDLQCLMNVTDVCANESHGFRREDLARLLRLELGDQAESIAHAALTGCASELMKHLVLAQGAVLARAHAVVVHSHYARMKLLCEHVPAVSVPPILVAAHPDLPTGELLPSFQRNERFVVGSFGWVSPSKRTIPIIRAFERFAARRPDTELRIVGQLPPVDYYDPVAVARASEVSERVTFHGYVDIARFSSLIAQTDLVMALRFPSCGETSGALTRARGLGVPTVTSDYAAFREEASAYSCRPDPRFEVSDIHDAMCAAYEEWRTNGHTRAIPSRHRHLFPPKLSLGDALELAKEGAAHVEIDPTNGATSVRGVAGALSAGAKQRERAPGDGDRSAARHDEGLRAAARLGG